MKGSGICQAVYGYVFFQKNEMYNASKASYVPWFILPPPPAIPPNQTDPSPTLQTFSLSGSSEALQQRTKLLEKNFRSTFFTWFRMTSKQRESPCWSGFDAFWICLLTRATGTFYLLSLRSYCKPKQSNNCVCEVCNESVTLQAYSYHKMSSQFLFSRTCLQKLPGRFPWNFAWIPLWRLFKG